MSDPSVRLRERIAQLREERLQLAEPFDRLIVQLHRRVRVVERDDVESQLPAEAPDHVETLLDQSDAGLQVTPVSGHGTTLAHVSIVGKGRA